MRTLVILTACGLGLAGLPQRQAFAQLSPDSVRDAANASGLVPLVSVPAPQVAGLTNFLKPGNTAKTAAIRLGKAFFWDMQAGSDGQACGSCHFHAGADNRARNQLSPGLKIPEIYYGNTDYLQFGPDYAVQQGDFPFHTLSDPEQNNFNLRTVLRDTNDVTSSMGAFAANFTGVVSGQSADQGTPLLDTTFNLYNPTATQFDYNVRRVEPRNTPTVINAVFTHSNFWDGRAHNQFNGVSPIGPLDVDARIWVNNGAPGAAPVQQQIRLGNCSLASQAVGPPTSDLEMSFFNRPFPMIGRKLLSLTPLGLQLVHPQDSVLGSLSKSPAPGLNTSYATLIQAAFQDKYWNGAGVNLAQGTFTQMEANFTLFWGLAIQLYETTLVSDRTPFDAFMMRNNSALTQTQLQGLLTFLNRGPGRNPPAVANAIAAAETALGVTIGAGNCIACHSGPEFTAAAFSSLGRRGSLELIEMEDTPVLLDGLLQLSEEQGLEDEGFSNIGVRPASEDRGRGADSDFPFPLSFVRQALAGLDFLLPPGAELPCTPSVDCPARIQVDGAFKIPGLRNVELTGPYFHNGGQATLAQVIEFYDRQSDFGDVNIANLDGEIANIGLDETDEEPLAQFLLSLTDERVRFERAPFDHPQILVPDGGWFANEQPRIEAPAVGAGGRTSPLPTFLNLPPI